MWNLVSVRFETALVSGEDRSTVCAERAIGLDWMHPMVPLGHMAQVDACFGPFGNSANLDAR
jgi:hypothetical protein